MNKINYKESINIESAIEELILINVDENISSFNEDDFVSFSGEIRISGEVKTNGEKKEFNHPLNLDISLSKNQLATDSPSISVEDFSYEINNNIIDIDLSLKIEGLKELETEFLTQEDSEPVLPQINEIEDKPNNILQTQEDTLEQEIETKETLMNKLFKRSIKKSKAYLIHVVKNETSYKEIAKIYNLDENILEKYNKEKEIKGGALIFIPNNQ